MKYVNRFFEKRSLKSLSRNSLLCLTAAALLGGCAMNSKNTWNIDGSETVPLVSTGQYLPIQERDKETGLILPYEAKPNPYTELSGRIDKDAVKTYIDARRAFNAKKYEFADKLLTELNSLEPKLSGPWVMRGDIAIEQKDLELALSHYAKAIEVNKINFNAYLRLAKVQRQQGHFNHAQNTYAKALDLWPDGPELHLNLGVLYDVYLNKPLQAQAHMEAYQLLSNDKNKEAAGWLAEVKQRTGVATALKILGVDGELEVAKQVPAAKTGSTTMDDGHQGDDNHVDDNHVDNRELAASQVAGE